MSSQCKMSILQSDAHEKPNQADLLQQYHIKSKCTYLYPYSYKKVFYLLEHSLIANKRQEVGVNCWTNLLWGQFNNTLQVTVLKHSFNRHEYSEFHFSVSYSGDLNRELVWYSNGPKLFIDRMVHYSSHALNNNTG